MASGKKRCLFAIFILFCARSLFAERVGFGSHDASIDLPDGYIVTGSTQNGFLLDWAIVPVSMLLRVYAPQSHTSAQEALEKTFLSLKATGETEAVYWRNQTGIVSSFDMSLNGTAMTGYAMAANLPEEEGFVVCLAWCPTRQRENCNSFMVSIVDSVNIDAGSYFEGGIMTQYLFPDTDSWDDVTLTIDSKTIHTKLRANAAEAATYLIEREYEVLYNYVQSRQWLQAWQRYYRMIFRDSYHRLLRASFDIYNELSKDAIDDTDLAQKLLTWTQGFAYEREKTPSDFANLPGILQGSGSDCDSRSLLLAVLLTSMNQDALLLVSAHYSHALAAFVSTHPGHSFSINGKDYLMGDTTVTGATWGIIAAEQDNVQNWVPISFP